MTTTACAASSSERDDIAKGWQDDAETTPGFASVRDALDEIAKGRFVVVLDDEDRENEGDLIIAAEKVTAEDMAFMVNHTSGLVCVGMTGENCDRLKLPQMVKGEANSDAMRTAFTVSVDSQAKGVTTGISASDRAATIRALSAPNSKPEDFGRPGHVFPLRAREGGVLKRAGHTEAAVDLARLAGCSPAGVLCEIVRTDGGMARGDELRRFAAEHGLLAITISDLIRYRRTFESLVDRVAVARLPTQYGVFQAYSYVAKQDGIEHLAMVYGDVTQGPPGEEKEKGGEGAKNGAGKEGKGAKEDDGVLVRVHSECLTGDILGSLRCDCGPQLDLAMKRVVEDGRGVVVYLRGHEGGGIGLGHKLRAYNLQDAGRDTVEANVDLGLPVDSREYGIGAHILRDVGVRRLRLMTNNPAKYTGLKGYGLEIVKRVPLLTPINKENKRYIMTKVNKMGHWARPDMDTSGASKGGNGAAPAEDADVEA